MSTPNFHPNVTDKPQDGKTESQPEIKVDETTQTPPVTTPTPPEQVEDQPHGNLSESAWLRQELEKVRKEAAARRVEVKEYRQKFEAMERKKLEEQGEYQRLYQQSQSELETIKLEMEAGSTYRQAFQETLDKRIQAIPENNRGLIPTDYDPIRLSKWLDANWDRLTARKFPNLDAGAGGSGGTNATPPHPLAQELAAKLGVPLEKFKTK